jgi:hypothetical protein
MMGVDPGREVASFCRDRGLDVFCGTLAEAPIQAEAVDGVAIWNTFDQLPNPDSTLAAARQMLARHGVLVVRIPNGSSFRRLMTLQRKAAEPMKSWLMATLAWNNLLGFPYVYGYTIRTLDQLLARHGFARLDVSPDTLMTIANQETTAWARVEEKLLKRMCLGVAQMERLWESRDDDHLAPWLDIYYRPVESVPNTTLTVATKSNGR